MPKSTFLNLTAVKQEKVETILLATFYSRHISQVKVSEIVEKMGMSRGTFYKYFIDLADAHNYIVQKASIAVHRDILTSVYTTSDDLFEGIANYLEKIAVLSKTAKEWQQIQLLTANPAVFAKRNHHIDGQNAMVLQWQELLLKNDIELDTLEETQELLFLIMDFVMEILTAFIVNDWDEKQLLKVYRMRIKWLKNGIQK